MEVQEQVPRPAIGDQYWFDFSKSLVDSAITRREAAAEALQKLVVWLWGIYTAAASVGFALSGKELTFGMTLLIALPSALLVLVYWGTVWVQMPRLVSFDPRSPTEIEQTHVAMVKDKDWRLRLTLLSSVATAAAVSAGLVAASVGRAPRFSAPTFDVALSKVGTRSSLAVSAYVGKGARADLRVTPLVMPAASRQQTSLVLLATREGLIQTQALLPVLTDSALVELSWDAGNGLRVQVAKKAKTAQDSTAKP